MGLWLVAYGVGGCWSGYTDAAVIQAGSEEAARGIALHLTLAETKEERGFNRGCSFDIEAIQNNVRECLLYQCRLKPGARIMADIAYADMTIAEAA